MVRQQESRVDEGVPFGLRIAAAWTWRLLILGVGLYFLTKVIGTLQVVIIPTAIALMLSALLQPGAAWLHRRGIPNGIASGIMLIFGLLVVGGTLYGVVHAFISGFSDLSDKVQGGINEIKKWLIKGPFHLSNEQIKNGLDSLGNIITKNQDMVTQGVLDTATTVVEILIGFFVVLFATFFFIKDGSKIWSFLTMLTPRPARASIDQAGRYAWRTLISYVRATVMVAGVDALGIGMAAWLLGLPLALPLGALVFLTAFIPVIGAVLAGVVAVLVALVTQGFVTALLMLAAVVAVQQLESHVLQPFLMGRAVAIHPLAVILSIAAGSVLGGIMGALVAVPIVAMFNTAVRYLVAAHGSGLPVPPGEPSPPGTKATDAGKAQAEESQLRRDVVAHQASPPETRNESTADTTATAKQEGGDSQPDQDGETDQPPSPEDPNEPPLRT